MTDALHFEDLEVGEVRRFGRYEVTREEVIAFASKYDPQPFHLDDEAAAKTFFGRIAASGWHTCAMMMAMLVEQDKVEARAALGGLGMDELRWLRPVYPGDVLSCETELLEKTRSRSKPHMGTLRARMTVFNQDGQRVLTMIAISLIAVRDASA